VSQNTVRSKFCVQYFGAYKLPNTQMLRSVISCRSFLQ